MLSISEIRAYCMRNVFQRGQVYYSTGRVHEFCIEPGDEEGAETVKATVCGSSGKFYNVRFGVTENGSFRQAECDCPYFGEYRFLCKHIVAAALRCRDYQKDREQKAKQRGSGKKSSVSTDDELLSLIRHCADSHREEQTAPIRIGAMFTSQNGGMNMEITIGSKRMYVVRNLPGVIDNLARRRECTTGTTGLKFGWTPEELDERPRKLALALSDSLTDIMPKNLYGPSFRYASQDQFRTVFFQGTALGRILSVIDGEITLDREQVTITDENPPIVFKLKGTDNGAELTCPDCWLYEVPKRSYILYNHVLYHCSEEYNRTVVPLLRYFIPVGRVYGNKKLRLSENDFTSFYATVLPAFEGLAEIQQEDLDLAEYAPNEPEFSVYLQLIDKTRIGAEAVVRYGKEVYDMFGGDRNARWQDRTEERFLRLLDEYFPESSGLSVGAFDGQLWDDSPEESEIVRIDPKGMTMRTVSSEDGIWKLYNGGFEALCELGSVYIDEAIRRMRIHPTPKVSIGVSVGGGLLDMDFNIEDFDMNEIAGILASYRLRKKYHRMKNGDFIRLEDNALSVLSELSEGLLLTEKQLKQGHASLSTSRAVYVDEILGDAQGVLMKRSADFRRLIRDIKDFRNSEYTVPGGLNASLRPYQTDGYQWLCTLYDLNLGGILADDMGLGKTLQIITMFLQAVRKDSGFSALVVAPTSVLFNWENEVHRFAPELSVQIIAGTAAERKPLIEASSDCRVNITSYDLLKRDIELYEDRMFSCLVLDEAQSVKNASTKAAHSVVQVKAAHRFALTGTPIENRVSDLWSIFNCVMPGYLYSYDLFRREIEQPIAQNGDEVAEKRLSRMVAPFLLRRKKSDVLKDLPEKLEENVFVRLEGEQKKLYEASRIQLLGQISTGSDSEVKDNRMQILAALTRLRQLCCSPELCFDRYTAESAKVDICIELLHNATASGHKVLVFSQFTSMLELLIRRWDESYLYLSGKDGKMRRQEMIDTFSAGQANVFFISLKAGGTGLNLTQADVVIHCDPWWNVAAQNQATDRAHRIGQKNVVHVIRLVAKDTIEEKILELQERKSALAGAIYETGENAAALLNRDNLLELLGDRLN